MALTRDNGLERNFKGMETPFGESGAESEQNPDRNQLTEKI